MELASEIVADALNPEQVLKDVGLDHRINNFPAQLSGGATASLHCTRVAKNPKILLWMNRQVPWITKREASLEDSPRYVSSKRGATVIIVTHNGALVPIADRVIHNA